MTPRPSVSVEPTLFSSPTLPAYSLNSTLASSPLSPEPDVDLGRAIAFEALLLASFLMILTYTVWTFQSHFRHFHEPRLQRLALRIAAIPLVYSSMFILASLNPHLFWLSEVLIAAWECYAVYNYFGFIVLYCGGKEGVVAEVAQYMQNIEFDCLVLAEPASHKLLGEGGGFEGTGPMDELGYLDIDDVGEVEVSGLEGERIGLVDVDEDGHVEEQDRTHARYYGATEDRSDETELQALYSPEALRSPRGSTTASRIAAILALRWKRLHISARFFLTKAIFTQDPKKQYELTQALILQAFFSKPLILLLGHTTHSESLANKVLHFSASLPLVVAMVALIHIYMILKPLLRSIQATRKLIVIKAIVIFLALQLIAVSYLESTDHFNSTFDVSTYSVHKRSTRFYCLLSIVEMALLCPVFKTTFSPDVFKCLKGSKVVRGLSPFSRAVEDARKGKGGEMEGRKEDGSLNSFVTDVAINRTSRQKEFKAAKTCCDRRSLERFWFVLKLWQVLNDDEVEKAVEGGGSSSNSDSVFTADGEGVSMLMKDTSKNSVHSDDNDMSDERCDALTALTPMQQGASPRPEFSSGKKRAPKFPGDMESFDSFANDGDVYEV